MRLWRAIQFAKRNGELHGLNEFIPSRKTNDCTVICPACPIAGVNFDSNELDQADDSNWFVPTFSPTSERLAHLFISRFLYNVTRSIDGNFHLHSKRKTVDPNDVPFIKGAYFPDDAEYAEHLHRAGETNTVCPIECPVPTRSTDHFSIEEHLCIPQRYGNAKSFEIQKHDGHRRCFESMRETRSFFVSQHGRFTARGEVRVRSHTLYSFTNV